MIVEQTTPYPWPYDRRLDPASTALIVCGAGARWTGRTPTDSEAVANITGLRALAAELDFLTVLLDHSALPEPKTTSSRPRDRSIDGCEPLRPSEREHLLVAAGIDGFYGSPLDGLLARSGRTHLLFGGFGLETTIHSTLRRANDRGYECLVVADACLSIDDSLRTGSLSSIELSGGIFGAVGLTNAVVTAFRSSEQQHP